MARALAAVGIASLTAVALTGGTAAAPTGGPGALLFHSERSGNSEIWSANLDGKAPVNLTKHPARDISPSWQPNGDRFVFTSDRGGALRLYVMDPATRRVTPLATPTSPSNPYWCTDTSIVVSSGADIYVVDTRTTSFRNLTNTPITAENQPTCTPDGARVLFHSSRSDAFRSLYDMPLAGGDQRQVSANGWMALDADVRGDGKAVLFFGRSPDGRLGLWENGYRPNGALPWAPTQLIPATAPRELRLSRYAPVDEINWARGRTRMIFGTDLPQGSAAPTSTRSIFRLELPRGPVRTIGYPVLPGEDANPVVQPLPTVYAQGSKLSVGGTNGSDRVTIAAGVKRTTVESATGRYVWDVNRDRVVRPGADAFFRAGQRIAATMRGGDDTVIVDVTAKPPRWLIDCGKGNDTAFISKAAFPFSSTRSCERIRRR